jgi:hypothetical protein
MNGGPTASERGREILRDHGFLHVATYLLDPDGTPRAAALELWSGHPGMVVLQDDGVDGWDLYLQASPASNAVAKTIVALHKWGTP